MSDTALLEPPPPDELLSKLLDDELSVAEQDELRDALQSDSQFRGRYADAVQLHALLHWQQSEPFAGLKAHEVEQPAPAELPLEEDTWWLIAWDFIAHPTALSALVSALVITTILLSLALWTIPAWRPGADDRLQITAGDYVARIERTYQAVWSPQSEVEDESDLARGRRIELTAGMAEVRFDDGALVLLEAPATFTPQNRNGLSLEAGKLTARVPPAAVGFSVRTPQAEIVDLGTEFGVEVQPIGEVAAVVFDGKIQVDPHGPGSSHIVSAGESLRIGADGQVQADGVPNLNRFVRELPRPKAPLPRPVARWTFANDSLQDEVFGLAAVPHGGAEVADGRLLLPNGECHLLLPDATEYSSFLGKAYSVVLWLRTSEIAAANVVVRTNEIGPLANYSHQITIGSDGRPTHYLHDGTLRWVTGEQPLVSEKWHQVAIIARRGAGMALYVDGDLAAEWEGPVGNLWDEGNQFRLGGPANSMTAEVLPGLIGEIGEVAVFARVLSAGEIGRLREASKPDSTSQPRSDGE